MEDLYDEKLTTHTLAQGLLQLGFTQQPDSPDFCIGALRVHLLDAPRLRISSPSGLSYVAVRSWTHLAQYLTSL